MKRNSINKAVGKFFRTTTLHGFKYLASKYYCDRVLWAAGCVASAWCAGVLCAVLWQRFLQTPALLQLRAPDLGPRSVPTVAVCQPPGAIAETFLKQIKTKGVNTMRLPAILSNALKGKKTEQSQVEVWEQLLRENNVSLLQMLRRHAPDCGRLTRRCRWRGAAVDCEQLFRPEPTRWGVCCVATPARFLNTSIPVGYRFDVIKTLDIGLQCFQGDRNYDCEFFTKYVGEEWFAPTRLSPGYNYLAQLTFVSEKDSDTDKLVDGSCISAPGYSKSHCLLKCTEKRCGCTDPLRIIDRYHEKFLPPCPLNRLSCLRTFGLKGNSTCACLPACQKMITKLVLETSPFYEVRSSLDPIHSGLNLSQSVVLRLRININSSKLFLLKPTETWLTLLSSLGGVFNMFLGVGLFSALEIIFVLVKLPLTSIII